MITLNEMLALSGVKEAFGHPPDMQAELSISTDTRTIKNGQAFLAIDGDRYRPLEFLERTGCAPIVIYSKTKENDKLARAHQENCFFVAVSDSVEFLQNIGRAVASKFVSSGGKLVAISGSNGKTTTKEMLFHILKSVEPETVCTQKNNNNHIGVPLTLLQINEKTKFCVLELGSNHPGEIELLCDIAKPNVGVTTNIGDTHLEFFHDRESVFKEEGYLYYAIEKCRDPGKVFFKNMDDEYLKSLPGADFAVSYGQDPSNDIVLKRTFKSASVEISGTTREIENDEVTGEHNFLNMGLAFAMAKHLTRAADKKLLAAVESFAPTKNRSEWIQFEGVKIFLDAYNANPSSMKAAITAFKDKALDQGLSLTEVALILGDMNELGDKASDYHRDLGAFCKEEGFSNIFFIGRFSEDYNAGCLGIGEELSSVDDFGTKHKERLLGHKLALIKGSRSLQLESIVDINKYWTKN